MAYPVKVNDTLMAELPNSSYVLLPLTPGTYRINVGDWRTDLRPSVSTLQVDAGRNYYLEFDGSQSTTVNRTYTSTTYDRRFFGERDPAKARSDMHGLMRAN